MRKARWAILLAAAVCCSAAASGGSAAPLVDRAAAAGDPVIAAAGDISCDPANSGFNGGNGSSGSCREKYTSDLLVNAGLAGVLLLGDNQYECGSLTAFQQSYDISWGRVKSITFPSLGNHEYLTSGGTGCNSANAGAAGYFNYFGAAGRGVDGRGFYSYDIGTWHLIALNSQCGPGGGCSAGSPQETWLKNDLATHTNLCTLAYWHVPLYSSGGRDSTQTKPWWGDLYAANADVVLSGHDHIYERFAPQNSSGVLDNARGIRQFVVGTGGNNHTSIATVFANSQVRDTTTFGVLKLTLHPSSYDWQFVPDTGSGSFTDSGSAPCHGATSDITPPTAPTTLTATAAAPNRINLSWGASTDNTGVTGYKVFRDGAATPLATVTTTSYSDTTVAPSSTHSYTVVATDASGNQSTSSNTATATTPADTSPPSQPTNLTATATASVQVTLGWTASTDNVGVSDYEVFRNGVMIADPATTSFSDTSVQPSTTYSYYVVARDAARNASLASATATATTPAAPTSFTLAPTDDTYVEQDTLTTNYGTSAQIIADNSPVKHLLVKFAVSGVNGRQVLSAKLRLFCVDPSDFGGEFHRLSSTSWSESTVTWNTAPAMDAAVLGTLGAVTSGSWYEVDVTPAVSGDGAVGFEAVSTSADGAHYSSKEDGTSPAPQLVVTTAATPADTQPPTAPAGLVAAAVGDRQINLSWTASTDTVGVDHYVIYRGVVQVGTSTTTSFSDTGLQPSTAYSYTVKAVDAATNASAASNTATATTLADSSPPTAPMNLAASPVSATSIGLSWTAATDDVAVDHYDVYRGATKVGSSTTTGYTDTALQPSTSYSYTVKAVDAALNASPASNTATATTLADTSPPTAPAGLTATAASATQINLSWTASTDNVAVDHYDVYRGVTKVGSSTTTGYADTALQPSTSYSYTVKAVDAALNASPASNTATATTLADTSPPTAPAGLAATAASATQINLSWTASTDDVAVDH